METGAIRTVWPASLKIREHSSCAIDPPVNGRASLTSPSLWRGDVRSFRSKASGGRRRSPKNSRFSESRVRDGRMSLRAGGMVLELAHQAELGARPLANTSGLLAHAALSVVLVAKRWLKLRGLFCRRHQVRSATFANVPIVRSF